MLQSSQLILNQSCEDQELQVNKNKKHPYNQTVRLVSTFGSGSFAQGGLPIKSDGGSECWALPLTLKYKKKFLFLTTLEYIFCQTEAPEV